MPSFSKMKYSRFTCARRATCPKLMRALVVGMWLTTLAMFVFRLFVSINRDWSILNLCEFQPQRPEMRSGRYDQAGYFSTERLGKRTTPASSEVFSLPDAESTRV